MFGAGLFGVFAFAALTTRIIAALTEVMSLWLAALIVTVVYAAVAAVLALEVGTRCRRRRRSRLSKQPKA